MHQRISIARAVSHVVTALALLLPGLFLAAANAATVGYRGPYYGVPAGSTGQSGVPGAPTAQKPQSKLWYAEGTWWGALWNDNPNNASEAFTVHRYDWAANTWVDTGVKLETRTRTDMDILWDGSHLYVAVNGDAPPSANMPAPDVKVSRYSYSGGTWVPDWAAPVTIPTGLVYSPVIDKDSTGMLWMTYTKGTDVMISHTLAGNDQAWVAPYKLPTPAGESTVSYDPTNDPNQPSSDISSVVAYDGNKVGVLWSNQRTQKVYWASHVDGAPDTTWSLDVAFDQPEGADDHINLKSVVGTNGGRVYAVTKTSMNGSQPIIMVLRLKLDGTWDEFPYAAANTNLTRPILLLDTENQDLYVFAAAGVTANSGGTIYYKKTSMGSPSFAPGRGTPFISDDTLVDGGRINNPSSTKQNLNSTTDLLVLANNDPTDYYYYNRLDLGVAPPVDTTAPNTTITSHPAASTTNTSASFGFTSNEAGSTFTCKLDSGTAGACTSPKSYTGLAEGSHTFSVFATDAAGNADASPATYTWTVQGATPPQALFADDFSSGALSGWRVVARGGASVRVVEGAVRASDNGVVIRSTSRAGSVALLRKNLGTALSHMTLKWTSVTGTEGMRGQKSRVVRVHDVTGKTVLSLLRKTGTRKLFIRDASGTTWAVRGPAAGRAARMSLGLAQTAASRDWVTLRINGKAWRIRARLGSGKLSAFSFGDGRARHALRYGIDDVEVWR